VDASGPSHEKSSCVEHIISSQEYAGDGQMFRQELSEQLLNCDAGSWKTRYKVRPFGGQSSMLSQLRE
jgi:hypothetical protein